MDMIIEYFTKLQKALEKKKHIKTTRIHRGNFPSLGVFQASLNSEGATTLSVLSS